MMYRFRQCREAKGLSQKFVAISLGVKAPSVSDWEKGKTNPTIENLIALSKLFGVSCDELLGLQDDRTFVVAHSNEGFHVADSEKELLLTLRSMNCESRDKVMWFINTLADSPATQEELMRNQETS